MNKFKPFIWICILPIIGGCWGDMPDDDPAIAMPGGYRIVSINPDDVEIISIDGGIKRCIPEKVVGAGWNTNFIVVKQQLLRNRGNFPGDTFQVPDPAKFSYWIINIKWTNCIGPMTEVEYREKWNSLGQGSIQIKSVAELK